MSDATLMSVASAVTEPPMSDARKVALTVGCDAKMQGAKAAYRFARVKYATRSEVRRKRSLYSRPPAAPATSSSLHL